MGRGLDLDYQRNKKEEAMNNQPNNPQPPDIVAKHKLIQLLHNLDPNITSGEVDDAGAIIDELWLAAGRRAVTPQVAGWQPIETAPKDGAPILLWWKYWRRNHAVVGWYDYLNQCWLSEVKLSDQGPEPTHWMPLPAGLG